MRTFSKFILVMFVTTALAGCQGNKQTGGTVLGGLAGGLLGAQVGKGEGKLIATGIGALAGAMVGGSIGQSLDEHDKLMMLRSSRQALEFSPTGRAVEWRNPDTGHYGSVTPTQTYRNTDGQYCREYTQDVVIGGERQKAYGKACRQQDGTWKIVG